MNTIIYFIRHSEPMNNLNHLIDKDDFQTVNEKIPLSITGEKKAEKLSKCDELQNIDLVISSNYVRTISTAKYLADENNVEIYINENFGERKFGVDTWNDLPVDFCQNQIKNPSLKLKYGESQIEVANRMYKALIQVLNENVGKRIAIVSHGTAISFLLMKLGQYKDDCIYFNDNIIMDSKFKWKAPDVFKLEFQNEELISIKNIREFNFE